MQLSIEGNDMVSTDESQNNNDSLAARAREALSSISTFCGSLSARCPDTNNLRVLLNNCYDSMPDCSSMFLRSYSSLYENRCFDTSRIQSHMQTCSDSVSNGASSLSGGCVSLYESTPTCERVDNDTKKKIYGLIGIIVLLALGLGLGLGLSKIECKKVLIKNKSGYTMYFDNGVEIYDGFSHTFSTPETGTKEEKFDWGFFAPYHCDLKLKRKGTHADITDCIKPNAFTNGVCSYNVEDKTSFSSNNLRGNK